ncbi:MAG: peptidase S58 family protein [Alphaproteobacteria bacterium]|nr:MAG: peptidase S58 family protein [Alphaproteobacteria bacterium]
MTGPGPRNLLTDVPGVLVGNAEDPTANTGVTVVTGTRPLVAAVHVMGGAPGTRETDLLVPGRLVDTVDAIVLSGGSAFGLDAAGGVVAALKARGRGLPVAGARVPIVPAAILFDLPPGGPGWSTNPYPELGRRAFETASEAFPLGSAGAGIGATTSDLRGGLGSASVVTAEGFTVAALAVVNSVGSAVLEGGPHFLAAPWEIGAEFGGLGPGHARESIALPPVKTGASTATTLCVVATDAALDAAQAQRLAVTAHDGIARAVAPAHTLADGDAVFAIATGDRPLRDRLHDQIVLGHAAATTVARAIARGVFLAAPGTNGRVPAWAERFGRHKG